MRLFEKKDQLSLHIRPMENKRDGEESLMIELLHSPKPLDILKMQTRSDIIKMIDEAAGIDEDQSNGLKFSAASCSTCYSRRSWHNLECKGQISSREKGEIEIKRHKRFLLFISGF
ncbi:hypothetical protein K1719_007615 [Acacia pycnantha]|nr:hypothetical protein K1719_007615 [Acacia pycnantha]